MATSKPIAKKAVTKKAAEVKKPEAKKPAEGKKIDLKIYFKTDSTTCTMFAILNGKVSLELHGNASSWNEIENNFGPFTDLIVKDVKEVEAFPDISVNFETSKIYRGHHE